MCNIKKLYLQNCNDMYCKESCYRKKIYHLIDLVHFDEMWEQMIHVQVHVNTWQPRNEWSASRVCMLGPGTVHLRAPCQGKSTLCASEACMEFEDLCSYITWTKGSLIIGLFDLHSMRTN